MIGSPIPCGIALAKKCHVDRIARAVEYISTFDTTVSGSRNAITPLFLWYAIHSHGVEGFRDIVQGCLEMADYAVHHFNEHGIPAWRNNHSITVVFPKGPEDVMGKWQIALQGDIGHILVMPHVTKQQIDHLLADMVEAKEQVTP
jgi:histidine decarboxylase